MSKLAKLADLALPGPVKTRFNDDIKVACEVLEGVAWCNRNEDTVYSSTDRRRYFVSKKVELESMTVTAYAKTLFAMVPKSWPAVLWMCDKVHRAYDLPFTPNTARRLLTAAVFLLLSTEDEDVEDLYKYAGKRAVETLGKYMHDMLKAKYQLPASSSELLNLSFSSCVSESSLNTNATNVHFDDDDSWEETLGMRHVGWIRGNLTKVARAVQRKCSARSISSEILLTPSPVLTGETMGVAVRLLCGLPSGLQLSPMSQPMSQPVSPASMQGLNSCPSLLSLSFRAAAHLDLSCRTGVPASPLSGDGDFFQSDADGSSIVTPQSALTTPSHSHRPPSPSPSPNRFTRKLQAARGFGKLFSFNK